METTDVPNSQNGGKQIQIQTFPLPGQHRSFQTIQIVKPSPRKVLCLQLSSVVLFNQLFGPYRQLQIITRINLIISWLIYHLTCKITKSPWQRAEICSSTMYLPAPKVLACRFPFEFHLGQPRSSHKSLISLAVENTPTIVLLANKRTLAI